MLSPAVGIMGRETDAVFLYMTGMCAALLGVTAFSTLFFIWKYGKNRKAEVKDIEGAPVLEGALLAGSIAIVLLMFYLGLAGYKNLRTGTPQGIMEVKATAQQWLWTFDYAGGRTENVLTLPKGRAVKISLAASDVLHSFYIPAFRVKQDVIPGQMKSVWFTPDEEGSYDLFCAEYCGMGHYQMITRVNIIGAAEFDEWAASGAQKGP